ncbi:MAG: rod shape-determining protein RodA [Planctomycetes bacterium]|nr:rod shape-determining protein RodA [Planctomycetota bacterium]
MTSSFVGKISLPLAGSAALLVGMGLFALWSHDQEGHQYFQKQVTWVGVGVVALLVMLGPHYRHSRHFAYPIYLALVASLVALLVFARKTNGAQGWFALGPLKVQPAEFVKIGVVLVLARWLAASRHVHTLRGLAAPILLALTPMGLILLQPDFGTAMLFVPVLFAMLYVAGARRKYLLVGLAALLVVTPFAYRFGLKEYQRDRLTSFLWPDKVDKDLSRQQMQSVRACAAGGLAGAESGGYYVSERHTDFVFSIVAEELGFLGTSFVLLLFAVLFVQAGWIAARTREPYGRLLAVGLLVFLAMQVFINIGMAIGVAPITGLTLPFMSYGGSSLVSCMLALGLILNVGARWVPTFSSRDLDPGHVAIREFVPQEKKWL